MDSADGLREDEADVHCLNFGALQFLDLVRNGVGHHHLETKQRSEVMGGKGCCEQRHPRS